MIRQSDKVPFFIKNFDLDPKQRFFIADLLAQSRTLSLLEALPLFELGEEKSFEVIEKLAPFAPFEIIRQFPKFSFSAPFRFNIAYLLAEKNAFLVKSHLTLYDLDEKQSQIILGRCIFKVPDLLKISINEDNSPHNLSEKIERLGLLIQDCFPKIDAKQILDQISRVRDQKLKEKIALRAVAALFVWETLLTKEELAWIGDQGDLVTALFSIHSIPLQWSFVQLTLSIAQKSSALFEVLRVNIKKLKSSNTLITLLLTALVENGVNKKSIGNFRSRLNTYKEVSFSKLDSLLKVLNLLLEEKNISIQKKGTILDGCASGKLDLFSEISKILMVYEWGGSTHLKNNPLHLEAIVQKVFEKVLRLPSVTLFNSDRFSKTFGSYRFPDALKIYAGKLKKLSDSSSMSCLGEFVSSVLDQTFLKNRYDPNRSLHMQLLHQRDPDLVKKWQENSSFPIEDLIECEKAYKNKGYRVYETDDPEDLFLCGQEVNNSCMRINGEAFYSRGLLGYLQHGQVRLIAIKDRSGRIQARSILRLLWAENKPALFLEKPYVHRSDKHFYSAIESMAIKCAKRLKVVLTAKVDLMNSNLYGAPLSSFGGSAPYEYCDGTGGITKGGVFKISEKLVARLY